MRLATVGPVVILVCSAAAAPPARAQEPPPPPQFSPVVLALAERAVDDADRVDNAPGRMAVYKDLLPVLGRLRDLRSIERVGQTALKLAGKNRDARAEVCAATSVAFALAGNRPEHERWMHDAIEAGAWTQTRVAWPMLARARLEGGDADAAAQLAAALPAGADRATTLAELAAMAARRGMRTASMGLLREARSELLSTPGADQATLKVVETQALLWDLASAERTARAAQVGYTRARALADVAQAALRSGDAERYKTLIAEAHDGAVRAADGPARATALLSVAQLRLTAGDADGAKETLGMMTAALKGVEEKRLAGIHLATAGVLARAGDPAGAAAAGAKAAALFQGTRAAMAAEDYVASLVAAGDLAAAQTAAAAIEEPALKARATARLAQALESAGKLDALAERVPLLDAHGWETARVIGRAHARAGKLDGLEPLAAQIPDPTARSGLWAGAAEGSAPR